ncbi:MAG: hypothetical protein AB7P97_20420 [Hyphomonadaceae bacterium]
MKRIGAFLILALLGTFAAAAVLTVSWQNATTNTDGTAIPATGDGSVTTRVEYGTCNAARDAIVTVLGTLAPAQGATTAPTPDLPPGMYCARAQHVNSYGVASVFTAVATRTVAAPQPNPPTNFSFGS